jgi:hypothetical protein
MDVLRLAAAFSVVFGLLGSLWAYAEFRKRPPGRLWGNRFRFRSPEAGRGDPTLAGTLSVIRQVRLTPTHQLHLVATGRERFLLCTHPQGCTQIPFEAGELPHRLSSDWREKGRNDAA